MATYLLHHCIGVHVWVYLYLFVVGVACIIQVSWAPVHMQVYTLYRYFWTSAYKFGRDETSGL